MNLELSPLFSAPLRRLPGLMPQLQPRPSSLLCPRPSLPILPLLPQPLLRDSGSVPASPPGPQAPAAAARLTPDPAQRREQDAAALYDLALQPGLPVLALPHLPSAYWTRFFAIPAAQNTVPISLSPG